MKKFLAIVFSLIFALSACTVAFAEEAKTTTCKYCEKILEIEEYNNHLEACKIANKPSAPVVYTYTCEYCKKGFNDADDFNKHLETGCNVLHRSCKFSCGNSFDTAELKAAHEDVCPKGAGTCDHCGKAYATQSEYATTHKAKCTIECADCGATVKNGDNHKCAITDKVVNTVTDEKTWEALANKAIDALKEVDWKSLADKVVGAVKGIDFQGIIAKIKPVIEKVVELVKGFAA
ncbi:MAG: C2H2-type zinc finger protein [Acutalibacteraceae bacterium]|nr:C2H2-type zinc finger protein [Acutalibacteraceae bacterium]